jgi:hypothetical protein
VVISKGGGVEVGNFEGRSLEFLGWVICKIGISASHRIAWFLNEDDIYICCMMG